MSTELKYWGVDSDSNFFCHWVWQDEPEIVMKVPVEVGGEEHRAAFYFICFCNFVCFFLWVLDTKLREIPSC